MAQQRRGGFKRRKKVDYIAANKIEYVDYKDTELLSRFVSERGKILPRRVTGTSAKNQRKVTTAIKRARVMALMPFVNEDKYESLLLAGIFAVLMIGRDSAIIGATIEIWEACHDRRTSHQKDAF